MGINAYFLRCDMIFGWLPFGKKGGASKKKAAKKKTAGKRAVRKAAGASKVKKAKKALKRGSVKAKRPAAKKYTKGVAKGRRGAGKKAQASKAGLEEIGVVIHYFSHVKAGVVKLTKGALSVGDRINIKGHTTGFKQRIDSLQIDHVPVKQVSRGAEVAIRLKGRVRIGDKVFKAEA